MEDTTATPPDLQISEIKHLSSLKPHLTPRVGDILFDIKGYELGFPIEVQEVGVAPYHMDPRSALLGGAVTLGIQLMCQCVPTSTMEIKTIAKAALVCGTFMWMRWCIESRIHYTVRDFVDTQNLEDVKKMGQVLSDKIESNLKHQGLMGGSHDVAEFARGFSMTRNTLDVCETEFDISTNEIVPGARQCIMFINQDIVEMLITSRESSTITFVHIFGNNCSIFEIANFEEASWFFQHRHCVIFTLGKRAKSSLKYVLETAWGR